MNRRAEVRPYAWATKEPALEAPRVAVAGPSAPAGAVASAPRPPDLPAHIGADTTHAFVWTHPAEAAGVLRALLARDDPPTHEGPLAGMTGRRVAAAFLCGLGWEVGVRVIQQLHRDEERAWVARSVAEAPPVTHATAMAALDHVRRRIEAGDYLEPGGAQLAGDLLRRACGEREANRLLPPSYPAPDLSTLNAAPPEVVAPFISHEHPQTIALLLAQLDAPVAAALLGQLTERLQADVAYRLATLTPVPPKVLRDVVRDFSDSVCQVFGADVAVGGTDALARVLTHAAPAVARNVLDQMHAQDPPVAQATRAAMPAPPPDHDTH